METYLKLSYARIHLSHVGCGGHATEPECPLAFLPYSLRSWSPTVGVPEIMKLVEKQVLTMGSGTDQFVWGYSLLHEVRNQKNAWQQKQIQKGVVSMHDMLGGVKASTG